MAILHGARVVGQGFVSRNPLRFDSGRTIVPGSGSLDRHFREIHTARQRVIVASNVYEPAGNALLTSVLPPLW